MWELSPTLKCGRTTLIQFQLDHIMQLQNVVTPKFERNSVDTYLLISVVQLNLMLTWNEKLH